MKILVAKYGALGDVLRTSYFIDPLLKNGFELDWITSPSSVEILRPYMDRICVITRASDVSDSKYSIVYSLDDEEAVINQIAKVPTEKTVGFYLNRDNLISYTDDTALWNDMGMRSKYGKQKADLLKKANRFTHIEIFKRIFSVDQVVPRHPYGVDCASSIRSNKFSRNIGFNCFAGSRWPSKSIQVSEYEKLIKMVIAEGIAKPGIKIFLYGEGEIQKFNLRIADEIKTDQILVVNSSGNIVEFFKMVSQMDLMVTSDSLGLHVANSCSVPTVSFFTSTSPWEIDCIPKSFKILSTDSDFCSYRPDARNSSITAIRLMAAIKLFFGMEK